MFSTGNIISAIGVCLAALGCGYWGWFWLPGNRIVKLRSRSAWNYLGFLTVVGMLVFVLGRTIAS